MMFDPEKFDTDDLDANDLLFDQLADGALSQDQYRRALAWAENRPDGWRRCALSFLEAQALSQDFENLLQPPTHESNPTVNRIDNENLTNPQKKPWSLASLGLALVASLVGMFYLGYSMQQDNTPLDLASNNLGNETSQEDENIENAPAAPSIATPSSSDHLAEANTSADQRNQQPEPRQTERPSQSELTLMSVAEGEEPQKLFTLPVKEMDTLSPDWMENQPSVMSNEVAEALEKEGYRVTRNHKFMPVALDDGRQAVVPVEDLQIVRNAPPLFQ